MLSILSIIRNLNKLRLFIKINNYTSELLKSKQLFHSPIYSSSLIELKILKTYFKIYQQTKFI